MDEQFFSTAEVAELLRLEPRTVTAWARSGKLSAVRLSKRHLLFRASEVRRLLEGGILCGEDDADDHTEGGA